MPLLTSESRELLGLAAENYREQMDVTVLEYLASRGITPVDADMYRLGVVTKPISADHEVYTGRLSIPYLTAGGVVNMKFRCLKQHDCKESRCARYLGLPGHNNLYNVAALFAATDTIAVCEGELDALVLTGAGIPAVGIPGASNWQKHYRYIFDDFTRVVAFCDGDEAGRKLGAILQEQVKATLIHMPDGKDVNDMFLEEGPQWLSAKVLS